jgi:hypothetical protein
MDSDYPLHWNIDTMTSIRDLQLVEKEALKFYHRKAEQVRKRIEAIRKERGTKLKDYSNDPNWVYMDPGRNRLPTHNGAPM